MCGWDNFQVQRLLVCFSSIFSAQNLYSIDSKLTVAKTRENIVIWKQIVVYT